MLMFFVASVSVTTLIANPNCLLAAATIAFTTTGSALVYNVTWFVPAVCLRGHAGSSNAVEATVEYARNSRREIEGIAKRRTNPKAFNKHTHQKKKTVYEIRTQFSTNSKFQTQLAKRSNPRGAKLLRRLRILLALINLVLQPTKILLHRTFEFLRYLHAFDAFRR